MLIGAVAQPSMVSAEAHAPGAFAVSIAGEATAAAVPIIQRKLMMSPPFHALAASYRLDGVASRMFSLVMRAFAERRRCALALC